MNARTTDPVQVAFGLTPLGVATTTEYHLSHYTPAVLEAIDLLLAGPVDRFVAETLVELELRRVVAEARSTGRPFDFVALTEDTRRTAETALFG